MSQNDNIRWNWLKIMYIYTIVGAGGFGVGIILAPNIMISLFSWSNQDPIVLGVTGSVYLAFALLSILGLRSPLKFVPVLLLQLCYKVIWFIGVILPHLVIGQLPTYAILYIVIFASFIIGDLIAIPFPYIFGIQSNQEIKSTQG